MPSDPEEPRFYLIRPCSAIEALYGKPCLLTDTMIAQILDALRRSAKATTDTGQEALDGLWGKFLDLWTENESEETTSA